MKVPHSGMYYQSFMCELSKKRNTRRYLEIGVENGSLLSQVHAETAIAVDPSFCIDHNVCANKKEVILHQCPSDEYFHAHAGMEPFDLIFIDGMHVFEYVVRDFYNAEQAAHPGSLIILHDCLPVNGIMMERRQADAVERSRRTRYDGWWTGDVWKIVPILRELRPDLHLVLVDCPPTGLVCVTSVDTASRILKEDYLDIIQRYSKTPNTWENFLESCKGLEIVSSAKILNDMDHSLYFRI